MADRQASDGKITGVECGYLFHGLRTEQARRKTDAHSHSFWQLELFFSRGARIRAGDVSASARPGLLCLVPPGVLHDFDYTGNPCSFMSFKFTSSLSVGRPWIGVPGKETVEHRVLQALHLISRVAVLDQDEAAAAGDLLASLMNLRHHAVTGDSLRTPLVDTVRSILCSAPSRPPSVKQLADRLGYHPTYLGSAFASKAGVPLKQYMDSLRLEHAKQMLTFTGLPVGEVAAEAGFADTFAFSRFFKRLAGESPSAWRERRAP